MAVEPQHIDITPLSTSLHQPTVPRYLCLPAVSVERPPRTAVGWDCHAQQEEQTYSSSAYDHTERCSHRCSLQSGQHTYPPYRTAAATTGQRIYLASKYHIPSG